MLSVADESKGGVVEVAANVQERRGKTSTYPVTVAAVITIVCKKPLVFDTLHRDSHASSPST